MLPFETSVRSLSIARIKPEEASIIEAIGEGQFSELKGAAIAPSKLSNTISAFANSDGGDLYLGINEQQLGGGVKKRVWAGFPDVEAANGHLQSFEKLFPLGTDFQCEFLQCPERQGLVLHLQVSRTQAITRSADNTPYIRRGAQNLPVTTPEALRRLEYAKGIVSFENETANAPKAMLT
jgi:ATP-dependent DNA helicase RecG